MWADRFVGGFRRGPGETPPGFTTAVSKPGICCADASRDGKMVVGSVCEEPQARLHRGLRKAGGRWGSFLLPSLDDVDQASILNLLPTGSRRRFIPAMCLYELIVRKPSEQAIGTAAFASF